VHSAYPLRMSQTSLTGLPVVATAQHPGGSARRAGGPAVDGHTAVAVDGGRAGRHRARRPLGGVVCSDHSECITLFLKSFERIQYAV
jgi:hypothetical protein